MEEFSLAGRDFIELHNLLKVTGLCPSGGQAKALIAEGLVRVNGQCHRRSSLDPPTTDKRTHLIVAVPFSTPHRSERTHPTDVSSQMSMKMLHCVPTSPGGGYDGAKDSIQEAALPGLR